MLVTPNIITSKNFDSQSQKSTHLISDYSQFVHISVFITEPVPWSVIPDPRLVIPNPRPVICNQKVVIPNLRPVIPDPRAMIPNPKPVICNQ